MNAENDIQRLVKLTGKEALIGSFTEPWVTPDLLDKAIARIPAYHRERLLMLATIPQDVWTSLELPNALGRTRRYTEKGLRVVLISALRVLRGALWELRGPATGPQPEPSQSIPARIIEHIAAEIRDGWKVEVWMGKDDSVNVGRVPKRDASLPIEPAVLCGCPQTRLRLLLCRMGEAPVPVAEVPVPLGWYLTGLEGGLEEDATG